MYGYINLPVGCPPKTINPSPPSADTTLAPVITVAASQESLVKQKMSNNSRGLYNENNDMSGKDAWVTCMLLNNDRKLANKAMFKAQLQAIVPQQTLNSLLISAKAKINCVTSGDLGSKYNVY
jgi:hypothetical protein